MIIILIEIVRYLFSIVENSSQSHGALLQISCLNCRHFACLLHFYLILYLIISISFALLQIFISFFKIIFGYVLKKQEAVL